MDLRRDPVPHPAPRRPPGGSISDRREGGPAPLRPLLAWLETALLAGAAVLVLHGLAETGDPLLRRGVAWLALAPLLAGLRYGTRSGAAAGAALALASRGVGAAHGSAAELALGWLLAGVLPGAFRDAWSRRLWTAEARTCELGARLEGLGRAYHALQVSHDRLKLETGARSSLRDAFEAFRRELVESPPAEGLASVAPRVLDLLREVASVRAAALYPVDGDGRPGQAVAALGRGEGSPDDALVVEAARSGEVVSVREAPAEPGAIAAVPLVDVTGRVHAVAAVHDLPFLSLHADTLALLAVIGGHAGDVLSLAPCAPPGADEARPLRRFCGLLRRARLDARGLGVPASLALARLEGPPGERHLRRVLARHVAATRRLTDDAEVLTGAGGDPVVLVLLRLADASGVRSHRARLERLARERARELGARCELRLHGWPLESSSLPRDPRELEAWLEAFLAGGARGRGEAEVEDGAVA